MFFPFLVRIWVFASVFASASGWMFSACGQLNRTGYLIALAVFLIIYQLTKRVFIGQPFSIRSFFPKCKVRFRARIPFLFLLLTTLIFLGGALYPPSNYDGLCYRTPRVLEWLSQGEWHWIHTSDYRMNNRGCGYEWLTAPLLLFTHSDRGLFLLNFASFLLLPGLVFSVFTRLGVACRTAWYWMWLLPSGYSFVLQAGSIANDCLGAVYILAAIDFALRARSSGKIGEVWLSILALALLTGGKSGNLPLALPWAIAIFPVLRLLAVNLVGSLGVLLLSVIISCIPISVANLIYCGDWTGLVLEAKGIEMHHPISGLFGNFIALFCNNFVPPIFPWANWWNEHFLSWLPRGLAQSFQANFESGFCNVGELPIEEIAGLGFGVFVLLTISFCSAWRRDKASVRADNKASWFFWSGLVSIIVLSMKSGMMQFARIIAAYYVVLIPFFLAQSGQERVVRKKWFKTAAQWVIVSSMVVVIFTPARPLWPTSWVGELGRLLPNNHELSRAQLVYKTYAARPDLLAQFRESVPAEIKMIGFIGGAADPATSLWRPFGGCRVVEVLPGESPDQVRKQKLCYIVIHNDILNEPLNSWLRRFNAEVVLTQEVVLTVHSGSQHWCLVRLHA